MPDLITQVRNLALEAERMGRSALAEKWGRSPTGQEQPPGRRPNSSAGRQFSLLSAAEDVGRPLSG